MDEKKYTYRGRVILQLDWFFYADSDQEANDYFDDGSKHWLEGTPTELSRDLIKYADGEV